MDKAPDAFRTISEVADDLDVPQHVLRFWETRFAQIRPMKRSGGRRYYRPDDVDLLRGIRRLLYGEGYTIRGVQRILKEHGVKAVQAFADGAPLSPALREAATHRADEGGRAAADADEIDAAADRDDDAADEDSGEDVATEAPAGGQAREVRGPYPRVDIAAVRQLDAAACARLQAVLDDLVACHAVLDQVLKEHPGKPLPD
ncbi:MAG: MerR family transcriptional regulator [Xanthobacteraceae bacterium]